MRRNPKYSLRAFARSLDVNPGALSRMMNGKQYPSARMAEQLIERMELAKINQTRFLKSLKAAQEKRMLKRPAREFQSDDWIELLVQKKNDMRGISPELFRVIGDWYHYAIMGLTLVPGFKQDPKWIADQLCISLFEARQAIDRLLEIGFLEKSKNTLVVTAKNAQTLSQDQTTMALRARQKQILQKSIYALEHVHIHDRNHTAMTMVIDPDRIVEAKKRIQEFLGELTEFLEGGSPRLVYEMQMSLFPLQKLGVK